MAMNLSIKNWAEDERPREKMLQKGAAALADAELLGILIASGTRERSAIELARDILQLAGNNLLELGKLTPADLQKVKGIGEARAITICAALELGRRRQMSEGLERPVIGRSKDALPIVMPLLQDLAHEVMCVLYLNTANKVLRTEVISSGGLTGTVADIKVILRNCLLNNATGLILAHNHPSGDTKASAQDIALTKAMKEAARLMDIRLLDHIIVAGHQHLSLADEGLF
ncbi:DNA repair protein RadC [Nemorincola caseinilytica]|uniref:DNA repair protein RadC n=2 Tax=Nemorincola caseinilytica TaxID=2054315 RepID=A0ABP8NHC2_9BACT